MKRIGIISDTHGFFDEKLERFLENVDEVWHAGDFGSIETADRIAAFKPLVGVYGNVDGGATRLTYPEFRTWKCGDVKVMMTHIGYGPKTSAMLASERPKLFVAGHSHILKVQYDSGRDMLFINPGAAGQRGFHQVRTAVRLVIDGAEMRDLEVGEWPRTAG